MLLFFFFASSPVCSLSLFLFGPGRFGVSEDTNPGSADDDRTDERADERADEGADNERTDERADDGKGEVREGEVHEGEVHEGEVREGEVRKGDSEEGRDDGGVDAGETVMDEELERDRRRPRFQDAITVPSFGVTSSLGRTSRCSASLEGDSRRTSFDLRFFCQSNIRQSVSIKVT